MQPVEEYGLSIEDLEALEEEPIEEDDGAEEWLSLARDAFDTSDTYYGASISKQVETNISMFNSRHPSGSKYNTDGYKYRSKIFRPKTRASLRRHEAAAAVSYFSTDDVILCEAEYAKDKPARLGAKIAEKLINLRLKKADMRWFQTIIGAYQDAMVQGAVISRQEWKYKEIDGIVSEDRPACDIVPIENFRFDPNADWRDPISNSPYLIELIPMYRGKVKEYSMQESKDLTKNWFPIEDEEIGKEETHTSDGARRKRNEDRKDSTDQKHTNSDFDIVWVHRNIIDVDGIDYIFYTLGTTKLLSVPMPLQEVYPKGRPYVMGFCNLETHKVYPSSLVQMSEGLQREINDIANQRLDNVKLVVNRRSFVRRNAKIDTRSLTQSVPGGVTLVDDINQDVRYDAPPDVTSSSYAEQDRLNADFDELAGSFSSGSIQTNRAMNETVGGMELMSADANSITEYQLRIFSETWVKPVIKQLVDLERLYETDVEVLETVSMGIPIEDVLQLLQQEVKIKISVGFGSINPQERVNKLTFALNTIGQFAPDLIQGINKEEITKEVFGALGYQDGERFLSNEQPQQDPQIAEMQQMIQQLQQKLQTKELEQQTKLQIEQMRQEGAIQKEQLKSQTQMSMKEMDQQIDYINTQLAAERNDISRGQLLVQKEAILAAKQQKQLEIATNEKNRMSDVLMRNQYGMLPNFNEGPGKG